MKKASKPRLIKNLKPRLTENIEDINARTPWLNEPDCLGCHEEFEKSREGASGFNKWVTDPSELYRFRFDNVGIRCEACHGSTHAIYPAKNEFDLHRDNIQPNQYRGMPYAIGSNRSCEVCHMKRMSNPVHHENMLRTVRNSFESK